MNVFPSSMHVHTHYGDGNDSPETMVLSAINLGFSSIGFAEHAYGPHDLGVCIPKYRMESYRTDIMRLKEKYAGKIEVSCGLEVEHYKLYDKDQWDHIVGSVHYVRSKKSGKYCPVDVSPPTFEAGIADAGEGDVRSLVEQYGINVMDMVEYKPDIIGHLDVIAKLNRGKRFFDPSQSWYKAMWKKIISAIACSGCITEVNTGGMCRGYTEEPYPSHDLLRMLYKERAPLTLCSDAHDKNTLDYNYKETVDLLREIGYRSLKIWHGGRFVDFPI